jgi:fibronectin-binding autotransporter adhesin
MRRLIFIMFTYLLCSNLLFSQITGDGSSGEPYHGTAISNVTWDASNGDYSTWGTDDWGNKVVYVCKNTTGYRSFTINAGVTVTLGAGIALVVQGPTSVFTINSSGIFVVGSGAYATVFRLTNNGTIRFLSDELGVPSLCIKGLYSGSGIAEENIYLSGGTGGTGGHRWHYISAPIDGISSSVFTTNPTTLNLAQYVEILVSANNSAGWIAYDGYDYFTGGSRPAYGFGSLYIGQGYNYYCSSNETRTFSGTLNNSDINISLTCGTGYPNSQGFNLIGNPFASVIDWDYVTDFYGIPEEVDNATYFTVEDGVASYINKVAVGGASEYGSIPPMQGFFVHVNTPTSGVTLTLPVDATTVDPNQYRYKGNVENKESPGSIPLVRIKFENQKGSDDLVLRFDDKATSVFDKVFDAYKFSKTGKPAGTWTKTGNIDYSINALPFPETSVEVPVAIYASEAGINKLSSNELKNLDNYSVTLKDLSTNITVDLKKGGIMVFNAPAGVTENRFVLTVTSITTSVPEISLPAKKFSIYSSGASINILSLTDEFNNIPGSVNIYDLTGRIVKQESNVEWQSAGELRQINLIPSEQGLYIIEIKAGNKKYVEKVNFNK